MSVMSRAAAESGSVCTVWGRVDTMTSAVGNVGNQQQPTTLTLHWHTASNNTFSLGMLVGGEPISGSTVEAVGKHTRKMSWAALDAIPDTFNCGGDGAPGHCIVNPTGAGQFTGGRTSDENRAACAR